MKQHLSIQNRGPCQIHGCGALQPILGFLTPGNFSNECYPVHQTPNVNSCEAAKGKIRTYRSKVRFGEFCHPERERRGERARGKEKTSSRRGY